MATPETLTLADLAAGRFHAGDFAVLGDPVAHSLSPVMHQASLALLAPGHPGLRGRRYHRIHITAEQLPEALAKLRLIGAGGLNLTVPHKTEALRLAQERDLSAEDCGAANTLAPVPSGWRAFNTDGLGFAEALAERCGSGPEGRDVVILGAGGAARAIATACLRLGGASLRILNRSADRAEALAGQLADPRVSHGPPTDPRIPEGAVVVNCTTLGLRAEDASPIPAAALQGAGFVYDTTYGAHRSALLREADSLRIAGCDGRSMLRWQGALAFRIWTGILPPLRAMARALGEW
jgi:shikimate dehydrogenase